MGECFITRRGGSSKVGTVAGSFYISNTVVQLTPANFTGIPLQMGDLLIGHYTIGINTFSVFGTYDQLSGKVCVVGSDNIGASPTITFDVYRQE